MDARIIVALSFGIRHDDPGLSNRDLARVVDSVQHNSDFESLLQWEIADVVSRPPILVVRKHRISGKYLDSEEVITQMVDFLHRKKPKTDTVILIAQPFLHRHKCKKIFKSFGYKVEIPQTGWIRFDKRSLQWYTRGPVQSFVYAILQIFLGRRGH